MSEEIRVLIVDDDPHILLILRETLSRLGDQYSIVTVGDGMLAMKELDDGRFDLVITDVRMPGMDGIELVEAIRALKLDMPVIWITAYGCPELLDDYKRLNVNCCLNKPLRISEIRQAFLQALEDSHAPTDEKMRGSNQQGGTHE